MNMIEIHQNARSEKSSEVYHEFLLYYHKTKKKIYFFVEGREDIPFYRNAIEATLPEHWEVEFWSLNNKDNVIKLYGMFNWQVYSKQQILFFIDRDLSIFLSESLPVEPNIFITDMYSIENDMVNKNTCERMLVELCNMPNLPKKEKDLILKLFDEQFTNYKTAMTSIMSWIILWRRKGYKPCLNDINMKHIFRISIGRLESITNPKAHKNVASYIHKQCNIPYRKTAGLTKTISEFKKSRGCEKYIRGKWVLWFLVEFVLSIHKNISSFSKTIINCPKIHIAFGHSNAIDLIATKTRIPNSLNIFLRNTAMNYVDSVQ